MASKARNLGADGDSMLSVPNKEVERFFYGKGRAEGNFYLILGADVDIENVHDGASRAVLPVTVFPPHNGCLELRFTEAVCLFLLPRLRTDILKEASEGTIASASANLALGNWLDPHEGEVDPDSHGPDYPERLGVILAKNTKDDRENDTAKIAGGAGATGHDTVSVRVHMGHKRKVGAVAGVHEEGHARNKTEHSVLVVRVREADSELEGGGDEGERVEEPFLAPDVGTFVNDIA